MSGEWGMGNGEWASAVSVSRTGMGNGEWGMGNGEWGMGLRLALRLRRALSRAVEPEWGMGNGEWGVKIFFDFILHTSTFILPCIEKYRAAVV